MTDADAIRQLSDLLACLDELEREGEPTPAFLAWRDEAEATIRRIFGDASREAATFVQVRFTPLTHAACLSDDDRRIAFQRGLVQSRYLFQTLMQTLQHQSP
ncbi:MAG: hypothetical protein Kow00123_23860 [Anaerolineales bacterium]